MTSIETFLKAEIDKADAIVTQALTRSSALQAARNKKRKEARALQFKKSRKRAPKGNHSPCVLPERTYAYEAFARQKICEYLLKHAARLKAGEVEQVLSEAAKARVGIGSFRLNAKFKACWLSCIEDLRATLSRHQPVPASAPLEHWNEGKIQSMLEIRVKGLEQGLQVLEMRSLNGAIAATLHLREYARLLVAKRFHTSHHLRDAARLKQVAPTIKLELPEGLVETYGEAGKVAWREAIEDFVHELLIIHGADT